MALKIISGAWISANRENLAQRNAKRRNLFDAAGVKPASSMRDIYVSGQSRLEKTMALFADAAGSRIEDPNLAAVMAIMVAELGISGLAAPAVMPLIERQSLGVIGLSPEVLQAFFNTDHLTSLERSITD
ncbi:hypothetical protein [Nitratireductor sp. ZSWI3]|uniref:hypothetical protein n=1 Tax=Nitratireductor sp. ZSWI3 TaxID=2966359 RepID=UPI0021505673|nr:hypothetical protein [Nitratireductor sp. ZSWI3]MCR4266323.1 hypothetical protein [Nitratireductor sp. ZSWI3]